MGYCFDYRGRLSCDSCGAAGGVRKRKCAYKVRSASHLGEAHRGSLPYCPAPALCGACYKKHGGLRGVHGEICRDGAAASQAREDAIQARFDAGDQLARSAFGSWHEEVPKSKVGVIFSGGAKRLVPEEIYDRGLRWLSELEASSVLWAGPYGQKKVGA